MTKRDVYPGEMATPTKVLFELGDEPTGNLDSVNSARVVDVREQHPTQAAT